MSSETPLYFLFAICIGALGGVHIPINGALGHRIGNPLVATFTFYGIAFVLISVVCLATWDPQAFRALATVPRWYFIAGLISVVVVGGGTFLIPRIGAVNLFVLILSAQLIVRSIISHFGWLESPVTPITWVKVVGAVFLVIGAILVVRR